MNKHIALSLLALVGLAPVALGAQPASATPTHTTLRFDAVQPRLQAQFDALVEAGFTGAVLLETDASKPGTTYQPAQIEDGKISAGGFNGSADHDN